MPLFLEPYKIFKASFISLLSAQFLRNGSMARFTNEDLLPGVDSSHAFLILNHCMRLVSARYNNTRVIKNASLASAKSITIKIERACPECTRVLSEKKYKKGDDVPLYPCADCKEENICDIWYKIDF